MTLAHGLATLALAWPPMPRFAAPWALLLLIVPLALMFVRLRKPATVVIPSAIADGPLPRTLRQRLTGLPRFMQMLSVASLIVALARPQFGEGKEITSTEAVAIQLVVDRSGSMDTAMAMDGQSLSRLDVVKRVLRDFLLGDSKSLHGRSNDLIGLVQFGTFADTVCPLVRDHRTVQQLVDSIPLARIRAEAATAIGDGIALAAARLRTAEQDLKSRKSTTSDEDFQIKSKVIVLLTDGINNAGERSPQDAAQLAAEWGIKVYTIGIASDFTIMHTPLGDQRIPVQPGAELDEAALKAIAETTGGKYWRATDGKSLREVYAEIDRLEKSNVKTLDYVDYQEAFIPWALGGICLLTAQMTLASTILRRTP